MKINKVILADDDEDDTLFFKDAFMELAADVEVICVTNETQLLNSLQVPPYPDIIFINKCYYHLEEFECIHKIKDQETLQHIPIAIYSDVFQETYIEEAYKAKANLYLCKPDSYQKIKTVLGKVIDIDVDAIMPQPPREEFVLRA
jgi:DNA-binding NarL/FixJ family response regulator